MTLGITLDQARAVIAGTLAAGHEKGFNPLTVVVLDAGGQGAGDDRAGLGEREGHDDSPFRARRRRCRIGSV